MNRLTRSVGVSLLVFTVVAVIAIVQGRARRSALHPNEVGSYGSLPLSFEPNVGQAAEGVAFVAHSRDGLVLLDGRGATVLISEDEARADPKRNPSKPEAAHLRAVRMEWVGAANSAGIGQSKLPGTANYFVGKQPASWNTSITTYEKVRFAQEYPGIDLVFHGSQSHLEYDIEVAPGVSESAIRLRFIGADRLRVDSEGELVLEVGGKELRQKAPRVFERDGASERLLDGAYRADGNEVAFVIRDRDIRRPLVIDPVLSYSTYLGVNGDLSFGIATDEAGNAYVTGDTISANFATTSGTFQTTFSGTKDAFVTKLNPGGTALVYSTYLGGTTKQSGTAIAVDPLGNAYVAGSTTSTDFPTTAGAFQTSLGGAFDVFVTKLNPTGTALVYSTYLGGSLLDTATGIWAERTTTTSRVSPSTRQGSI